ncbi:hypothetical protein GE09DRAFT_557150 [Coniochaeta sp. 2T2.1]|nr:hypothetical protein GE09DRAFT_557150 [Coniochaeta sp. 2T2.1]
MKQNRNSRQEDKKFQPLLGGQGQKKLKSQESKTSYKQRCGGGVVVGLTNTCCGMRRRTWAGPLGKADWPDTHQCSESTKNCNTHAPDNGIGQRLTERSRMNATRKVGNGFIGEVVLVIASVATAHPRRRGARSVYVCRCGLYNAPLFSDRMRRRRTDGRNALGGKHQPRLCRMLG